ncbi:MAG: glycosyltransferase [Acidobacteriota bacterium]
MLILTNIARFPARWTTSGGERGQAVQVSSLGGILRQLGRAHLILIDCNPKLVLQVCALFTAFPWMRRPLVANDLVLRQPERLSHRLLLGPKRLLLARVDHFIHYFKDLSGYQRYFGIGPERSSFVPFKPNLRGHYHGGPDADGQYVLLFGRSLRDFDTFFDAIERLPYPAAIARPDFAELRAHGARFTRPLDRLPPQVRLLEHRTGEIESQIHALRGARLVVLPLLKSCLVGVGTCLNAMLLGKCVIISQGPATNGLLAEEALIVPPEDPAALAEMVRRAWVDDGLRERTAAAGHRYASSLGGERELIQRLLDCAVAWRRQSQWARRGRPGPL